MSVPCIQLLPRQRADKREAYDVIRLGDGKNLGFILCIIEAECWVAYEKKGQYRYGELGTARSANAKNNVVDAVLNGKMLPEPHYVPMQDKRRERDRQANRGQLGSDREDSVRAGLESRLDVRLDEGLSQ